MRGPGRARLQRSADRLGDLVITNLAWCARSRLVIKSVKPIPGKALAPLPHRAAEDAQSLRYQPVVNPFGGAVWNMVENAVMASPAGLRLADQAARSMTVSVGLVASVGQPLTLRMVICPEASRAQNSMAAVSGDGSTVCVLIRRLNSSCSRSTALVVRAERHWPGGRRVKVNSRSPASSRLSATARHFSRHLRRNAVRRSPTSFGVAA